MDWLVILICTLLLRLPWIQSRSWQDVVMLSSNWNVPDTDGREYLEAIQRKLLNETRYGTMTFLKSINNTKDTQLPSPSPSDGPTKFPSTTPSDSQTMSPSDIPTETPTFLPSGSPLHSPSTQPSTVPSNTPTIQPSDYPTDNPSLAPTQDPYPRINGPRKGERGYFDYDPSADSEYGPTKWGDVVLPKYFYWDEFGKHGYGPWRGALNKRKYRDNVCERGLKHQSPIDVHETMIGCNETHEIRDHNGDHPLNDTSVEKRIESNKLRLIFPRRPCSNILDVKCQFPHPPWADFPNGFPGIADVLHIDLKVPSEHWLRGESFDGEIQIYHMHVNASRAVAISTLIRATERGHNQHFQLVLDVFQEEYDKNQNTCARNRNVGPDGSILYPIPSNSTVVNSTTTNMTNTMNTTMVNTNVWNTTKIVENSTLWDAPTNFTYGTTAWNMTSTSNSTFMYNESYSHRILHDIPDAWDPYHIDILPTIYFYRYDGSITEPPCSEIVTWFISDTSFNISRRQLEQWKKIQFTNVDPETCRSTSVQYRQSVARPIKSSMATDRIVTRCTAENFGPDMK